MEKIEGEPTSFQGRHSPASIDGHKVVEIFNQREADYGEGVDTNKTAGGFLRCVLDVLGKEKFPGRTEPNVWWSHSWTSLSLDEKMRLTRCIFAVSQMDVSGCCFLCLFVFVFVCLFVVVGFVGLLLCVAGAIFMDVPLVELMYLKKNKN